MQISLILLHNLPTISIVVNSSRTVKNMVWKFQDNYQLQGSSYKPRYAKQYTCLRISYGLLCWAYNQGLQVKHALKRDSNIPPNVCLESKLKQFRKLFENHKTKIYCPLLHACKISAEARGHWVMSVVETEISPT